MDEFIDLLPRPRPPMPPARGRTAARAAAPLMSSAGRTIHDVIMQVERLSSLIGEISASSSGQSERTAGIGRSVASLDNTTQQNAAMAEQSAAAAASLDDQARRLSETVAVFQV